MGSNNSVPVFWNMRNCVGIFIVFLLSACGPRGGKTAAPAVREFPSVDVPVMLEDPAERTVYATTHFWDRFTDTAQVYACDSLTVNGVPVEAVESQVGLFTTLAAQIPLSQGTAAMARLYDRLDAFERKYPDSNVFEEMVRLVSRYLYDANSPVRSEDLYLPFVERLGASDLIDNGYRMGYEWDARNCRKNRLGTRAADFSFTDTAGRIRTLYGINAEFVVLIFANPGCGACQEITAAMSASPEISSLIRSGRLKVVDVYIDQEIDDWKAHVSEYPADWINGYDHDYLIRSVLIYNVRAIPSIYLLDAEKTVLMKDAPQEKVLQALAAL